MMAPQTDASMPTQARAGSALDAPLPNPALQWASTRIPVPTAGMFQLSLGRRPRVYRTSWSKPIRPSALCRRVSSTDAYALA